MPPPSILSKVELDFFMGDYLVGPKLVSPYSFYSSVGFADFDFCNPSPPTLKISDFEFGIISYDRPDPEPAFAVS